MVTIATEEIRAALKKYDKSIWNRNMSHTDQLWDTKFDLLSMEQFRRYFDRARQCIADFYEVKLNDLPKLWIKSKRDCDNFAAFGQAFFKALYSRDEGHTLEPAQFRVVGRWNWTNNHAFNITFLDGGLKDPIEIFCDYVSGVVKTEAEIHTFGG